jgi:glyoxylase I family protein
VAVVHHSAICVGDLDASLSFWRDGLGFAPLMDHSFSGDWRHLLRAETDSLRAVFLGDPSSPDSGIVELVELGPVTSGSPPPEPVTAGFLLLSVFTDVDAALDRLAQLGLGGEPRRVVVHGVKMATVVDPDGVVVELVDTPGASNLEQLQR